MQKFQGFGAIMIGVYKLEIEVEGQPQGKQRPRFTRRGTTYTPQKTVDYENKIKAAALAKMKEQDLKITERFVHVDIIAFMDIPKSWSKVKRLEAEYGAILPMTKPDIDNIVKAALDGISGVVVHDDKQVTSVKAKKTFCHPDRGAVLYIGVSWTSKPE